MVLVVGYGYCVFVVFVVVGGVVVVYVDFV